MTRGNKNVALTLLCVFTLSGCVEEKHNADVPRGMSAERLSRIDTVMKEHVDSGRIAGVTTLVARDGELVHFETVGKLNLDSGEDLKPDSLFRIASMTKPIVTTAAMILLEDGSIRLQEPVAKYLPAFEDVKVLVDDELVPAKRNFTIQQLMSHTAGFTYGFFDDTKVDQMYLKEGIFSSSNLNEFIESLAAMPLRYQPGTEWVYSVSVDVLGALIEVVSGQPLDEYLDQRIFTPLGMDDTFFEIPMDKMHRLGTTHSLNDDGELVVDQRPDDGRYTDVTMLWGGGGLVSTAEDYLRYAQMMLNGGELDGVRIVSKKTVELMTTDQLTRSIREKNGGEDQFPENWGFGLGFGLSVGQPLNRLGSVGEFSWAGADGTLFWIDPAEGLVAISLLQQEYGQVGSVQEQFRNLVYQAIIE